MKPHSINPVRIATSTWQNGPLIRRLIVQELEQKYKGSYLGLLWTLFLPLLLLSVYTFCFKYIFNAKWPGAADSPIDFAILLFAGLIVFNVFSEAITKSTSVILSKPNFVKKVVFPLEVLPIVILGAALIEASLSFLVWTLMFAAFYGTINWTIVFAPLVLLPITFYVLGSSWFLASLGVFIRDVNQIIVTVMTALLFLSPIFYPIETMDGPALQFLLLNPLTPVIESLRDVAFYGRFPDYQWLAVSGGVGLVVSILGFAWFQKTRKGFADVI